MGLSLQQAIGREPLVERPVADGVEDDRDDATRDGRHRARPERRVPDSVADTEDPRRGVRPGTVRRRLGRETAIAVAARRIERLAEVPEEGRSSTAGRLRIGPDHLHSRPFDGAPPLLA